MKASNLSNYKYNHRIASSKGISPKMKSAKHTLVINNTRTISEMVSDA